MHMRLLIIEDHESLGDILAAHLREADFAVDLTRLGADALAAAAGSHYDASILDLGLPDMDGLAVLRALRAGDPGMPVLILTARDRVEHRIAGLDAGADDYILKPFDLAELLARLRAVLRRPGTRSSDHYSFADVTLDTTCHSAQAGGRTVELTDLECRLLEILMKSGQRIVVRDVLTGSLYGFDRDVSTNALEALTSRLRRKLAAIGSGVRIEIIRGVGYRLRQVAPPP